MTAPSAEVKSPSTPVYLTAADVARLLQTSVKTIYRLAASDPTMPALRLTHGGTLRFHRERLQRWLDAREQGRRRAA